MHASKKHFKKQIVIEINVMVHFMSHEPSLMALAPTSLL